MTPKKAPAASDTLDALPELFAGDTGTLPLPARKALVLLLKHTHLVASAHPDEWHALNEHEEAITTVLHNLFLELVMDPGRELAYKRQAAQGQDARFPTLLRNRAYTRDEVAMLLHLRESYRTAMYRGDAAAYIDEEELLEAARLVRPESIKDHVAADKTSRTAVKRLFEDRLLQRPRDTAEPDRYLISAVIETVLTVDRLQAFSDALVAENDLAAAPDPVLGSGSSMDSPGEDSNNAPGLGDPGDALPGANEFEDVSVAGQTVAVGGGGTDDASVVDPPGLFDTDSDEVGETANDQEVKTPSAAPNLRSPQFQAAPADAAQNGTSRKDTTE